MYVYSSNMMLHALFCLFCMRLIVVLVSFTLFSFFCLVFPFFSRICSTLPYFHTHQHAYARIHSWYNTYFHMLFHNKFKRQTDCTLSWLSSVWLLRTHTIITVFVGKTIISERISNSWKRKNYANQLMQNISSKRVPEQIIFLRSLTMRLL